MWYNITTRHIRLHQIAHDAWTWPIMSSHRPIALCNITSNRSSQRASQMACIAMKQPGNAWIAQYLFLNNYSTNWRQDEGSSTFEDVVELDVCPVLQIQESTWQIKKDSDEAGGPSTRRKNSLIHPLLLLSIWWDISSSSMRIAWLSLPCRCVWCTTQTQGPGPDLILNLHLNQSRCLMASQHQKCPSPSPFRFPF